jgi:glutaminyl-tRNA synthetase
MTSDDTGSNFLRTIISTHLDEGRYDTVVTRFPPEPNGYMHVGHAKSVCVNFGLAEQYGGTCNLRFDDTNPTKESVEFAEAIMDDIRWLGFEWDGLYYASDYFQQLYEWAIAEVKAGRAYVDSQSLEEIRATRGTVTEPGTNSPYRDRTVEENLELLEGMRRGDFEEGSHVLRAKVDMAHPNMKMRDPLLYRIMHHPHWRTGTDWHIYPMYDWAHGPSDAIEGITHSICTLEFENNRALYDLFVERVGFTEPRPHQYEMARLKLPYTMMSKRRLRKLVEDGLVSGWDDPRMPTIRAMRKKGIPPDAIRDFVERVGVAKANSVVDPVLLDNAIRDALNLRAPRYMGVLDPLEVVVTTWDGETDWLDASLFPHDVPLEGARKVPFGKRLYIERSDFMRDPVKGFRRLAPGREVRLRYGYLVTCDRVVEDDAGNVVRLECSHDPDSRGGKAPDGRKVKGTIHWVSADHAVEAEARLYERLFDHEEPDSVDDWESVLNPNSLQVTRAYVEPAVADLDAGARIQLERTGYFYLDPEETTDDAMVLTRIVPMKDTWARDQKRAEPKPQPKKVSSNEAPAEPQAPERTPEQEAAIAAYVARGVGEEEASVLVDDTRLAGLFEQVAAQSPHTGGVAKWVVHGVGPADTGALTVEALAALVAMVEEETLTTAIARDVLAVLIEEGGMPAAVVEARGWKPVTGDDALAGLVDAVLADHPEEVAAWRGGKDRLKGFFVGQVMKRTQGRADARRVHELLAARQGG